MSWSKFCFRLLVAKVPQYCISHLQLIYFRPYNLNADHKEESIPIGCISPVILIRGGAPYRDIPGHRLRPDRDPLDRDPLDRDPQTEIPPPGQRSPPPGQRSPPPGQRSPPPGQRSPEGTWNQGQRSPEGIWDQGQRPPRRNIGPGSKTENDIIQRCPCEQNS